jgi:hypothetical protein
MPIRWSGQKLGEDTSLISSSSHSIRNLRKRFLWEKIVCIRRFVESEKYWLFYRRYVKIISDRRKARVTPESKYSIGGAGNL